MICNDPLGAYSGMLIIGSMFSLFVAVLMYFIANLFGSQRIKATAIGTLASIISTAFIGIIIVFLIQLSCSIKVDSLSAVITATTGSLNPAPHSYINLASLSGTPGNNIYNFSLFYLSWAKITIYKELEYVKNKLADSVKAGSRQIWSCKSFFLLCLVGGAGESSNPSLGESYHTSIYTMRLTTLTAGIFTVIAIMKFMAFVQVGLFNVLFPIAVVARSLPGLRVYGNALLSIFFVFYLLFPLLITLNALLWFPVVSTYGITYTPDPLLPLKTCLSSTNGFDVAPNNPLKGEDFIFLTLLSVLTGIFIPALNILIMVAAIRHVGRLFDQDIFTGRLFDII